MTGRTADRLPTPRGEARRSCAEAPGAWPPPNEKAPVSADKATAHRHTQHHAPHIPDQLDPVNGFGTATPADDLDDDLAPAEPDTPPHRPDFTELGVRIDIVTALDRIGIIHPFPVQAMTLPVALSGHDIIGQAKTGTGKTLGFGIPVLQQVTGPGEEGWDALPAPGKPQALVITPTRELAVQVASDLGTASERSPVRILTVYGGRAYEPQIDALDKGVEVVVGTPGRLLDLAQQGHLEFGHARIVVLDEADEMLDLGFLPDVERLFGLAPAARQTMLFSATMPGPVVALARRFMTQPTHIRATDPDDTGATVQATAQFVYRAHALDKVEMLTRILQARGRGLTIIFARTKRTAAKVTEDLDTRGFAAAAIHGDLGQGAREQALRAFRKGKVDVLVATDVAARGIDVDDVTHVVNYQCPEDEKTYLHRIGRTGRAGNTGTAITFVDWDELSRWTLIDKTLDLGIPEPTETYSSSPHLYSDLDIPVDIKGRLPESARTRAGLDAEDVEDLGETRRRHRSHGRGGCSGRAGRDGKRGRDERRSAGRNDGGEHGDSPSNDSDTVRPRSTRQRRRTRAGRLVSVSGTLIEGDTAAPAPELAPRGDTAREGTTRSESPTPKTGSAPVTRRSAPGGRRRRRSRGSAAATAGPAAQNPVPTVDGPQARFLAAPTGDGEVPSAGDRRSERPAAESEPRRRRRRRRGRERTVDAQVADGAPVDA